MEMTDAMCEQVPEQAKHMATYFAMFYASINIGSMISTIATPYLRSAAVLSQSVDVVKLREREGQRVDLGRSLKGHLWMVDGGWWYTFP